jgi:hypothetical protein
VDFPWRYASDSAPLQALRLAQQLAGGADPHYYFMGLLEQPDREPLNEVRRIFRHHAENVDRYADLESAATVALYQSSKSARYDGAGSVRAFRGAYEALVDAGVVFDLVHDTRAIDEDFVDWHKRYGVIVLSGASCMSEPEAQALDAFVAAGGALLVIGEAGSRDELGRPLPEWRLQSLPVSGRVAARPSMRGGYVKLDKDARFPVDTDVILLDGPYFEAEPKPDATRRHRIEAPQPFGPPELCYPGATGAAAAHLSGMPGVVSAGHGEGRVSFIPWRADELYHRHALTPHRVMIAREAAELVAAPVASLSATGRIETTVQRQTTSGDLLIHVVNYSGQSGNGCLEPVTLHGAQLKVRESGFTCRALVAGEDVMLRTGDEPGVAVADLPPIGTFEVLWLRRKAA